MRIIVGITGASGIIIAVSLLKRLRTFEDIETHLLITEGGLMTIHDETNFDVREIEEFADVVYSVKDTGAAIASGTFQTAGMVIVPCSMKTVAGIAGGYCENLLLRAADVCIKEQRKLVLIPREMPFSSIHLRNMKELADLGVVIMPPVMTFYHADTSIDAQIDHIVDKILSRFDLPTNMIEWRGKNI